MKVCNTIEEVIENVEIIHPMAENNDEACTNSSRVQCWVAIFDSLMNEYHFAPVKYCGYAINADRDNYLPKYFEIKRSISGTVAKDNMKRYLGFVEFASDDPFVEEICDDLHIYIENKLMNQMRRSGVSILLHPKHLRMTKPAKKILQMFGDLSESQREFVYLNLIEEYDFSN